MEKDVNNMKLVFLDQYLKENQTSIADYKIGYLSLLMAFNQYSKSTPACLVQAPNRPGLYINLKSDNSSQSVNQDLDTSTEAKPADMINCDTELSPQPKCLSYNDCIKSYDQSLLTPNKITVNHLLSISPIFGDISDAFGHILLDPQTALTCQIFLFKDKEDSFPTLDLKKAKLDKKNEPILFPLVYSCSTYGSKDMPMIFGYTLTQCVKFFKENSLQPLNTKDFKNENLAIQANQVRLDFVENILCAAYVDDVSINNQFQSLVEYFIKTYTFEERLIYLKKAQPTLKGLELIAVSEDNFIQGMSNLSSKNFDIFLKDFAQFLNLQLAADITTVLQFNGFYIKAWESLDEKHTIKLNKNLPKEVKSEVTTRVRPEIEKTQKEITKLQKTIIDESLIYKEDEGLASVTQLGCTLTQWTYRIKSRVASYQKKTNQKVVFNNYEEAEKHLDLNPLSKRQL